MATLDNALRMLQRCQIFQALFEYFHDGFLIDLLGGNFFVGLCPQQAENKSNTNPC